MSRINRKGRSKGSGRFVQLHHFMMEKPAWRTLSPQARAVYVEIAALYDGTNNGRLALGVRDASDKACVNKDTASRCFKVLVERGFIECAQQGAFRHGFRHTAEWRLTKYRCDRTGEPATNAFMKWSPEENLGPLNSDSRSPDFGRNAKETTNSVPPFRTGTDG